LTAANIIGDLPVLKWRGLEAPCESASYRGSHSQAERRYPYIDGAGHDWTGRDPYQFTPTRLHFLNTIKPYNWFPTRWNDFRAALENGTSGDLDHPDLGTVRARVLTWEVDLTAQNRGGIVVNVVWSETVDNLDERVVFLGPDVTPSALASAADDGMSSLGIDYPDGVGSTSFSEMLGSIEGFAFSARLSSGGAINQAMGVVSKVVKTVENVNDHAAWALRDNLTQLWDALRVTSQQFIQAQRATGVLVTSSETTIDAIARDVGNSVSDITSLNIGLVRSPGVPRNTRVTFYTGGTSISSPLRPPGP
jgi:hypothetical protein